MGGEARDHAGVTDHLGVEKQLYYHGYDASKKAFWADMETGLSPSFWLRAMGWFACALADLCGILPVGPCRELAASLLLEMAGGVQQYADKQTGLYWQVVDQGGREGNYLETSGSAMLAYAMLKGVRLGVLPKEYAAQGRKTFDGIVNKYLHFDGDGIPGGHLPGGRAWPRKRQAAGRQL